MDSKGQLGIIDTSRSEHYYWEIGTRIFVYTERYSVPFATAWGNWYPCTMELRLNDPTIGRQTMHPVKECDGLMLAVAESDRKGEFA